VCWNHWPRPANVRGRPGRLVRGAKQVDGVVVAIGALSGQDRRRDPVTIDTERRAARGAFGNRTCAMRSACPTIDRLPDVRLEGRNAFAAGKVAEIHGVRLIGGEAVVATVRIRKRSNWSSASRRPELLAAPCSPLASCERSLLLLTAARGRPPERQVRWCSFARARP
jgi:hypothetical protein